MTITSKEEYLDGLRQFDAWLVLDIDANPHLQGPARALAEAIQDYEIRMEGAPPLAFPLPPKPETLPAMIELKRQQKQLKQKDLAALLEIPAGRLSQILSGKRRVSLDLAKKLHERLNISPAFILRKA